MKKLDVGEFIVRFSPETTMEVAEKMLNESCCFVKVHRYNAKAIGSIVFNAAVVDLCLCHLDVLRSDGRIKYWEQIKSFTSQPNCCDGGGCGCK